MGVFDLIFGTTKKAPPSFDEKLKLTRQDIVDLVWSIGSLDSAQKKLVQHELESQLDDGGVSMYEYKEIIRKLAEKRVELGLSEIDIKNLKKVL